MEITTPLPGRGGTIVRLPVEAEGTVLDPKMEAEYGVVHLPTPVLSWEERVVLFGDSEPPIVNPGGYNPTCRTVLIPGMEPFEVAHSHIVLDPITYRADNLIRTLHQTQDPTVVQRSVTKLQDEIVSRLAGKDGILSRHVYSIRCAHSVRFVIVTGIELEADEVGIPRVAAKRAGIEEDDLVILSRAPILWQGSVQVVKAKLVRGHAGRLSPWGMQDLGADCDGDTASVIKWPEGVDPPQKLGPETPRLPMEVEHWMEMRGMTLGVSDLLHPETSRFRGYYDKVKGTPTEVDKYTKGVTVKEYLEAAEIIALDMGKMKMQLGLVGSITDKICALVSRDALPTALEAKEIMVQALLDSKHESGSAFDLQALSNAFENGTAEDMQTMFDMSGVPCDDGEMLVKELVAAGVPPLTATFREQRPDLATIKSTATRQELLRTFETVRTWGNKQTKEEVYVGPEREDQGDLPG